MPSDIPFWQMDINGRPYIQMNKQRNHVLWLRLRMEVLVIAALNKTDNTLSLVSFAVCFWYCRVDC